jgi:hypothetical protein
MENTQNNYIQNVYKGVQDACLQKAVLLSPTTLDVDERCMNHP